MRECVEILIDIERPIISELHETITSIIEQTAKDRFDISVRLNNQFNLKTTEEEKRLKDANIIFSNNKTQPRFTLNLKSGEIISKSFLYKGIHYLINNKKAFVCPEYTFRRLEQSLTIATTYNYKMLVNKTSANLIDHQKEVDDASPRASIIKDTCVALNTLDINHLKFIKNLKKEIPYFDSPLFHPSSIDNIKVPSLFNDKKEKTAKVKLRKSLKNMLIKCKVLKNPTASVVHNNAPPYLSDAMKDELRQLTNIKFGLKGYKSMKFIDVTYETFLNSEELFKQYRIVAKTLQFNNYSYVMILPWLIHGGIDLFATNYLNSLAEISPNQHILSFLTNGTHHSFTKEELGLAGNVDLINLPELFEVDAEMPSLATNLIYSFINTFKPSRVHIMSSQTGYHCLEKYGKGIRDGKAKIIYSSYNYIIGPKGDYLGYAVQNLPRVYQPGDTITTDNLAYKKLCVEHYGFLEEDILVHHQLFNINPNNMPTPTSKDGLRILWAAHVRPEKNPEVMPKVAKALQNDKVDVDCYGFFSPIHWPDGKNPLDTNLENLHYKGEYSNFFNDIDLKKYDLFLFTSHTEGTPNVIIEAALAGLPIVSSRVGGIPDIITDEKVLVKDTHSADEFIEKTKHVLFNLAESRKKATALQKELFKKHSKSNFTKQVKGMLERSKQ